jgi:hypothetical protein
MALDDPLYLVGPFPTGQPRRVLVRNNKVIAHSRACCCPICFAVGNQPSIHLQPTLVMGHTCRVLPEPAYGTWWSWWPNEVFGARYGPYWEYIQPVVWERCRQGWTYGSFRFQLGCHEAVWTLYAEIDSGTGPCGIMEITPCSYNYGMWWAAWQAPGKLVFGAERGWPPPLGDTLWKPSEWTPENTTTPGSTWTRVDQNDCNYTSWIEDWFWGFGECPP